MKKENNKKKEFFNRKISEKESLEGFSFLEFLEFLVLREMNRIEKKNESNISKTEKITFEPLSYYSLLALTVAVGGKLYSDEDLIYKTPPKSDKNLVEIFISNLRLQPKTYLYLLNFLYKKFGEMNYASAFVLAWDHAHRSDTQLVDEILKLGQFKGNPPTDEQVKKTRQRLGRNKKEWLDLRKKFSGKFYLNEIPGE